MHNELQDNSHLKKLEILYVEDDEAVRQQFSLFLKRRVGSLLTADNGDAGLRIFREKRPDIVITDILMPVMDGLDMAQEIRNIDDSVPIIVTTAFEQTSYLMRSIEIGVDKYVIKPVKIDLLHAALIHCAHRLRGEELIARQRKMELESLRVKHMESLGVLAGGLAHDFNNLLQVILGYISLARLHAEPGSKIDEFLATAESSSDQARELGQRLLTLANGKNNGRLEATLVSTIIPVVTSVLEGSGIEVEFDLPENLPMLLFNKQQMQQIATYLTINAREAMPEGGTFRVSAKVYSVENDQDPQLAAGNYLHIVFSDTGHGIAPENLPRLFEPYFTTKQMNSQKGMGLSLALCHAIIGIKRGSINVESTRGQGADFHIYLPIADAVLQHEIT